MSSVLKAVWYQTQRLLFSSTDRMTIDTEDIELRPATDTHQARPDNAIEEYKRVGTSLEQCTRASSFPLLKLPGEIRNRVYEFCLVPRDADGSPKPVSPYQPALTRVNRVVRSETLELFYAINKFKVYMKVFDDNDYDPGREHKYMQLLRGIRNLVQIGHFQLMNELEIQLTYAWRPHPYTEEPRPFLRARILSKGPHVLGSDWFLPEDYVYDNIDRLSVGDTDWGDVEAVDSAVELYKFRLCEKLADMDHDVAAEELEYLPCGRMCEVLRALLHDPRLSESSKRSLFFDAWYS